jgi:hypothetical protein
MTTDHHPDLFTNVHKGIRRALFAACTSLGDAEGDADRERSARALLAQALHFVAHHGENEDVLLLPLLRARLPQVFGRMSEAHGALDGEREGLSAEQPVAELYLRACAFTPRYLAHLDEEERVFEPLIRAVLSMEEGKEFGRNSVQRTAPADQRLMLGWMLPAMTPGDSAAFLDRLPPSMAADLRTLLAVS